MQHLPEVLKIVEGGLRRDAAKVTRYVELLCRKLEAEGDTKSAELLKKAAGSTEAAGLKAADVGVRAPVPVDAESRVAMAEVLQPTNNVPLVLAPEARAGLEEFIQAYERRSELLASGLESPGHVLLYGPPGSGKTQTAMMLAGRLGVPLVTARLDGLISSFLGSTAKNIRALFEYVDSMPCLLFLDEFDAIAKMRDDPHDLGELKRVVNSLLQNIDFLPSGVSVIAATNHEHLLDPAVWRRFEFHVHIGVPDVAGRRALLHLYLPDGHEMLVDVLAAFTRDWTAADIKGLCQSIARHVALDHGRPLSLHEASRLAGLLFARNGPQEAPSWIDGSVQEQIIMLRDLDADIFTYDVISQIVGVSKGKISGVLSRRA